jgi:hypothetical protein
MFSAACDTPTPTVVLGTTECCAGVGMKKITCPLCGSDRLIKVQLKRVTRTGNPVAVYCCASDAHMFLPEIEPRERTVGSSATARSGKRRAD